MVMARKLIFTYNADSGFANTLLDIGHRVASPSTYKCNLCKLTYGVLGQSKVWKEFISTVDAEVEFLHADEFKEKYGVGGISHPSLYDSSQSRVILQREDIDKATSLDELISIVRAAI